MAVSRAYKMSRTQWLLLALLVYSAMAVSLTAPALVGHGSLIPERFLDQDPLYGPPGRAELRPFGDSTPIVLELGRDRAVASGLREGRLDTWNPWSAAGSPLWTEQGGPFFPTRFIYYAHPNHTTLMASLAARLVVGAFGMFVLAAALGLPRPIALFTGGLFGYSGTSVALLPFATASGIYMLPWALFAAHALAARRSVAAASTAGLVLAIAWFGGHPSFALIVYLAFGAWLVGECLQRRPPIEEVARVAALALAAGFVALLVAAVTLVPFIELVRHGQSYKDTSSAELAWAHRLQWTRDVFAKALLFPSLVTAMRDTIPANYWPYAEGGSIGLVALLLAVAGAPALARQWPLVLVLTLGIGLTLAPFGLQWLHRLPGVRIILPWYCFPLVIVPLCLMAAFGLQRLAAAPRTRLLLAPIGVAFVAAACLGVALALAMGVGGKEAVASLVSSLRTLLGFAPRPWIGAHVFYDWQTWISPLALIAGIASYVVLNRRSSRLAAAALALVGVLESALIRIPTVAFERSAVLQAGPSATTRRLQDLLSGGTWRYVGVPPRHVGTPNTSLLFQLRDFRSVSALAVGRIVRYMDISGPRVCECPELQAADVRNVPALSLAGVRYVIYEKPIADLIDVPAGLRKLDDSDSLATYENPAALPRFRVVHDAIAVDSEQRAFDTLKTLLDDDSSPLIPNWSRRVVIEGLAAREAARVRSAEAGASGNDAIERVDEPNAEEILIHANLKSDGFVVVADTFYPGWEATVDGGPAPIHPANLLFRAVAVPAGRHSIVMKYQPWSLRIGIALTSVGLLFVVASLARHGAALRRREQPDTVNGRT